jgi:glycosyltransferase involved in cell wall biosynthesis
MKKVLYVQYTNPAAYPPLEHSAHQLAEDGWEVLFLGIRALGGADMIRLPSHERICVQNLTACPPGLRQKIHFVWYALWVLFWAIRWRPQWIYASDDLSAPTALLLSFWPRIRVIYHEHDSPTDTSSGSLFMRMCYGARLRLARRCVMNILPNEQRAARFASQTGATNISCVWNCPSRAESQSPRAPHTDDVLWLVYHGTIVPPRLPLVVLDALKSLPDRVRLRVFGYETSGHRGYIRELQDTAARLGIAGRIEFHGAIPERAELLAWGRSSDVGLAFMPQASGDINMQHMLGASNKPFDYLACGTALLVSDLVDWRKVYVDAGYGLACDPENAQSIAAALRWFWEHRAETQRMGECGRQRVAAEWNYEVQFAGVLKLMNEPHPAADVGRAGVRPSNV